ncbi:hypothetical protein C480_07147 [Natrialba aegyptia DSM 13077]|uniref:Uncharacterized protein n=1 Tax=Natrialba aegyptia DSM 13077 TaxID=1227491 RepID=M0BAU5_9EURY|nr:hypothetical protein C480_07147 [Natrialba aegyptia DSM 13077]
MLSHFEGLILKQSAIHSESSEMRSERIHSLRVPDPMIPLVSPTNWHEHQLWPSDWLLTLRAKMKLELAAGARYTRTPAKRAKTEHADPKFDDPTAAELVCLDYDADGHGTSQSGPAARQGVWALTQTIG